MAISQALLMATGSVVYATWNPADKGGGITLSNGNRTAKRSGGSTYETVRATKALTGKRYWEVTAAWSGSGETGALGIATASLALSSASGLLGSNANDCGIWGPNNSVYRDNVVVAVTGVTQSATYRFAFDAATGALWIGLASPSFWLGGGDPAAGTAPTVTMPAGVYYPAFTGSLTGQATANFGDTPFTDAVPAGFSAP